jgi:hypothetical protein
LTPKEALDLAHELKQYRHDPLRFVLYAYPWGVEGTPLAGRTGPEPWQREVLEYIGQEMRAGRFPIRIAVASGHGIGKSALMAWIRGWSMATMAHTKGRVTANTETQLRTTTLPEFAKWHNMQAGALDWFEGNFSYRYKFNPKDSETWRFDAVAWSETRTEAFAGLHNAGNRIVVLYDEASAIADTVWETTEGALTDKDTEILWLAFGNPTRSTGRFAECWGRHRESWWTLRIDARTVSFTNHQQIADWIAAYGEDSDFVRVRVKGQQPRASDKQFIPFDLAEGAASREAECWPSDPLVLGVDVARFGDDQSVIVRRRGRDARTWPPLKYRGIDTMQLAARVASLHASDRPDAIFVDEGGVGGGVVDRLRQLGVPVTGVNFGGKPDSGTLQEAGAMGERYANKRAEMWGVMRAWLPRGAIPKDDDMITDLTGVEYGYNADNAIQLERKEDMKKRGLDSPDIADALALTFAYPVVARGYDGARSRVKTWDPAEEYLR